MNRNRTGLRLGRGFRRVVTVRPLRSSALSAVSLLPAFLLLLAVALCCNAPATLGHPLAPSLLELREEGGGRLAVRWKTPATRPLGSQVEPVLPSQCRTVSQPTTQLIDGSLTQEFRADCGTAGLTGAQLAVDGLAESNTQALVRITHADGRVVRGLLDGSHPSFTVPAAEDRRHTAFAYFCLGVEHLMTGLDHLLFVLGLTLLVRGRKLLATVTAFTAGHSITLSLAVLGVVRVPAAPIELAIAFTIFLLAVELTRDPTAPPTWMRRSPWLMAASFGLLHGFGFAGALSAAGLPANEVPLALFSFNIGIEVGQLAFIAVILASAHIAGALIGRLPSWSVRIPAYTIGSLAVFWCFERAALLLRG